MRKIPGTDRRTFLKEAGGMLMAASMDAHSYARILGANDRIRLGQLGCGTGAKVMYIWCNLPRSKFQ
jgi:hypothetical protein